jgi:hypothetical protein
VCGVVGKGSIMVCAVKPSLAKRICIHLSRLRSVSTGITHLSHPPNPPRSFYLAHPLPRIADLAAASSSSGSTHRDTMIAVKVKTLTGETRTVDVGKEWTGAQLRDAVCGELGVSAESVQLIARGRVLSDSDECMEAVKQGGAPVQVVPRARSGFDLRQGRRQGHSAQLPGMSLEKPEDVAKFIETMTELGDVGDAQVMLKVEGRDGKMVESTVALQDLLGALQHAAQNHIGPFAGAAAAAAHTPAAAAAATTTTAQPTGGPAIVNPDEAEEVRRHKMQEMYEKGQQMYAEREQKKLETVRISSKLQELKDKRAARAAKRWKREQRRRGLLSTENSTMPKSQPANSPPLFAGLKKGFLL